MPNTGDQHNDKVATRVSNPYEESKPHLSEYTAQEIATLSSRLEKQLGPEYISSRPGAGGGKVHYLAAGMLWSLRTRNHANEKQTNASTWQTKCSALTAGQAAFSRYRLILYA